MPLVSLREELDLTKADTSIWRSTRWIAQHGQEYGKIKKEVGKKEQERKSEGSLQSYVHRAIDRNFHDGGSAPARSSSLATKLCKARDYSGLILDASQICGIRIPRGGHCGGAGIVNDSV